MQPTVTVPYAAAERDGTNQHISSLNKRFGRRVTILLPVLMICLRALTGHGTSVAQSPASKPANPTAPSDAQKAFGKMKTLAGSWQGTIMSISVNVTIHVASSGNAVLYEATTGGGRPPDHEITTFYLDGDRLLATHYCDAGNRARFEGKVSPDGKTIEFSFLDVAGGTQRGLVKRMLFTIIDADHHGVELTFIRPDGKSIDARGEFQRDK